MKRLGESEEKSFETMRGHRMKTARAARSIREKMMFLFFSEMLAESMWRAIGWLVTQKMRC